MEADAARAVRPPLFVLVAISALQPFALNVLAPATPGLAHSLETDYATIQLTLTLYLVAVAVTQLIVGPISDRFGRRPCVLAAIGMFMLGSAIGAAAEGIGTLLLARIVQGIGGGTCFALSRAIVRDTSSKNQAASLLGYITMAMVVSPMVAPLVGGFIDVQFGWRAIFLVTLSLTLPVALAAYWFLRETVRHAAAASLADMAQAFPDLVGNRTFVAYALAVGFTTASFFIFIAGAPYIVVEAMGQKPEVYGLFFLINAGGYMAGNFVSGRFGERLGPERLILFGIGFSIVSMVLSLITLALAPWVPASFFLPLVINSFGNGLAIPGGMALALSVRPDLAGTAAGITGALQLGLGALGTVVVGYTVPLWPTSVVWAMLVSVVIGAIALGVARQR